MFRSIRIRSIRIIWLVGIEEVRGLSFPSRECRIIVIDSL